MPLIGSLPARATPEQALTWIRRQQGRHGDGAGFSFAVADARTDVGVGTIGLWLRDLDVGRATAGYTVAPSRRGRRVGSDALTALAAFAWTVPGLRRVELHVEPWNVASTTVAERAGFRVETLLRRHQEIGGRRRDMLLYVRTRA